MNTNLTEIILNQAPEVYEQMTRWGLVESWIGTIVCLVALALILITAWKWSKSLKDEYDWCPKAYWGLIALLALVPFLISIACLTEIAKIKTAPKAWLVDRIISKTK